LGSEAVLRAYDILEIHENVLISFKIGGNEFLG
jgi:hypothetical protein